MHEVRAAYRARFQKVVEYIDSHLDEALTVEHLAERAQFSKHHFHRQFVGLFELGVYEYVLLARLKRASYELAFRAQRSVLEIALDCGYESPEAFARAFKKRFGQTPSEFRKQPDWATFQAHQEPLQSVRKQMKQDNSTRSVTFVDFPETRVAVLQHRGPESQIGDTIRRFIAWRKENRLPRHLSATFNVFRNDGSAYTPNDFRMDLCAATNAPVAENAFGVVAGTIPAGRCAVLRHLGSDDSLPASVNYLYAEWLPTSSEEPRDFPIFLQRVAFFPDVPEHEAITDIFLPVKARH